MGRMESREGAWVVIEGQEEGERAIPLARVPAELAGESGSIVWVAGTWEGQALTILSYGVVGRGKEAGDAPGHL